VLARESVVAISGDAGSPKTALLNRTIARPLRSNVRIVRIGSPSKEALDLRRVLDPLIGTARDSGGDPAEQFIIALTRPHADERQVSPLADDAQTFTGETLNYLDLVASAASIGPLPL